MNIIIDKSPQLSRQDIYEFLQDLMTEDKAEVMLVHTKKSLWDIAGDYEKLLPQHRMFAMRQPCGKIVAMGGISDSDVYSTVWLLCTDKVQEYPLSLYKACRNALSETIDYAAIIYLANKAHVKFAERLGFMFIEKHDDFGLYIRRASNAESYKQ